MSKTVYEYALLTAIAVGLVVSQLLLKQGMRDHSATMSGWAGALALVKHVFTTPSLIAGYLISAVMTLFWLVALSRMELSFALPTMNGIFYALLLFAAAAFFGESISMLRLSGVALVVAGIVLIARSRM